MYHSFLIHFYWRKYRLLPCPSYCKQCCDEHWGTRVSFSSGILGVYAQQWDCRVVCYGYFKKRFYYPTSLQKYLPAGSWNLILKNANSFNSPNRSWQSVNFDHLWEVEQLPSNIQHTSRLNFLRTTFQKSKIARIHQSIKLPPHSWRIISLKDNT